MNWMTANDFQKNDNKNSTINMRPVPRIGHHSCVFL